MLLLSLSLSSLRALKQSATKSSKARRCGRAGRLALRSMKAPHLAQLQNIDCRMRPSLAIAVPTGRKCFANSSSMICAFSFTKRKMRFISRKWFSNTSACSSSSSSSGGKRRRRRKTNEARGGAIECPRNGGTGGGRKGPRGRESSC